MLCDASSRDIPISVPSRLQAPWGHNWTLPVTRPMVLNAELGTRMALPADGREVLSAVRGLKHRRTVSASSLFRLDHRLLAALPQEDRYTSLNAHISYRNYTHFITQPENCNNLLFI